jgi:TetR/AcrR family transcriptional repressor of lmrAB and yxaGH operons
MPRLVAERADAIPALAELFREHGFDGASLALISERTGLGRSSLYHFFPGGKEEMAAAVLAEIDGWFEREVFGPLRSAEDPVQAVADMLGAVEAYFHSGRRICLVGAFALNDARDRFAGQIRGYFARWRDALADALGRQGRTAEAATGLAEAALAAIQGGLVLARALDDPKTFQRTLARVQRELTG